MLEGSLAIDLQHNVCLESRDWRLEAHIMRFDDAFCCFRLSVCCANLAPILPGRGRASLAGINT